MDVKVINPFVNAVTQVFETMVQVKMTVGKPFLKTARISSDVCGIIGFSGDAAGSAVICFSQDVACKAASRFAGIDINQDHDDFADAIGELANMIAGTAKREFTDLDIRISLPNVIIGRHFEVSNTKNAPRIIIPYTCELGEIQIEIGMEFTAGESPQANEKESAEAGV